MNNLTKVGKKAKSLKVAPKQVSGKKARGNLCIRYIAMSPLPRDIDFDFCSSLDEAAGTFYNRIIDDVSYPFLKANNATAYIFESEHLAKENDAEKNCIIKLKVDPYGNVCVAGLGDILRLYSEWRDSEVGQTYYRFNQESLNS